MNYFLKKNNKTSRKNRPREEMQNSKLKKKLEEKNFKKQKIEKNIAELEIEITNLQAEIDSYHKSLTSEEVNKEIEETKDKIECLNRG